MSKRPRDSVEEEQAALATSPSNGGDIVAAEGANGAARAVREPEERDEDDQPLHRNYKMSKAVRTGAECPYLDTISRQVGLHCACDGMAGNEFACDMGVGGQ